MTSNPQATQDPVSRISTADLAVALSLRPQSLRKRFSATGSYFGVTPLKLRNGRLLWPADAIEQLAKRGQR